MELNQSSTIPSLTKSKLLKIDMPVPDLKTQNNIVIEIEKSFSHTRPDGRNFGTAITDLGITYRGAGENIAWGQKTPEAVMNAWMNSEGHRANILNPNFKKLGVGYRTDSQRTPYWTQLFTY